jgi:4-hydroxy-tetrahydrodipicolinate reductase
MVNVVFSGAAGRMGRRLIALTHEHPEMTVVAGIEATGHPDMGETIGPIAVTDTIDVDFDVLVDFSLPAGTMQCLAKVLNAKKAMVIGTTGHTEQQLATIRDAAKTVPIVKAGNMSLGVNVLFKIAGQVAKALGPDYDIEIVEHHHRHKVDAPSGTALGLLQSITEATGQDPAKDVTYGRQGHTGERSAKQIGMHSLRLGDTVGEHEVHFGTLGETVILKHSAHARDTFAVGALRAALWIKDKPAGLYSMQDVLFGETT